MPHDGRAGAASGDASTPTRAGQRTGPYLLVTPCRDEAAYARRTLDSIVQQTVLPKKWLIVDDGSTDETPSILADYAARYPFIEVVRKEDRGARKVGPGVIEAFYVGYEHVDAADYSFVTKLDLDLDIPPRYFERMLELMEADPRLGTVSGKPYFPGPSGELVSEGCGDEMSVGMIKFYRRTCFEEIGGFVREVMWDGIDCHHCRMLGWKAKSLDEPEIRFIHLRPMGSSHQGIFTGRRRHGFGQYFMGTWAPYMAASAAFRMTHRPYVVGGLAMWVGFLESALKRKGRYDDPAFRSFLRRYQRDCLRLGKKEATRRLDERQRSVWEARHPGKL